MVNKKKDLEDKHIYLSDIYDEEYFNQVIGSEKYLIFDKQDIIKEMKAPKDINENVFNHMVNTEVSKALIKILRNKKIKNVIYMLYTSPTDAIRLIFENNLIPQLNSSLSVGYSIITCRDDFEEYEYQTISKNYSNIYVKE
jgi:hypothetical protein